MVGSSFLLPLLGLCTGGGGGSMNLLFLLLLAFFCLFADPDLVTTLLSDAGVHSSCLSESSESEEIRGFCRRLCFFFMLEEVDLNLRSSSSSSSSSPSWGTPASGSWRALAANSPRSSSNIRLTCFFIVERSSCNPPVMGGSNPDVRKRSFTRRMVRFMHNGDISSSVASTSTELVTTNRISHPNILKPVWMSFSLGFGGRLEMSCPMPQN